MQLSNNYYLVFLNVIACLTSSYSLLIPGYCRNKFISYSYYYTHYSRTFYNSSLQIIFHLDSIEGTEPLLIESTKYLKLFRI